MRFFRKRSTRRTSVESIRPASRRYRLRTRWTSFIRRSFRRSSPQPVRLPEVDLYDIPGQVVIAVETWDMEPENIEIRMNGRLLTLVSKKTEDSSGQRPPLADFHRSVVLPAGIQPLKACAKYKGKRLVIRIPKEETVASTALDKPVKL